MVGLQGRAVVVAQRQRVRGGNQEVASQPGVAVVVDDLGHSAGEHMQPESTTCLSPGWPWSWTICRAIARW